jgi:lysophospholipase
MAPGWILLIAVVWLFPRLCYSNGYAPRRVSCPSGRLVRPANVINDQEEQFAERNRGKRERAVRTFLKHSGVEEFEDDEYLDSLLPIDMGIALSGGGFRAMLSAGGVLAALDDRTDVEETEPDFVLGGLLQGAAYLSGLSGSSWLIGSMYHNGFAKVQDLRDSKNLWNLDIPRNKLPPGLVELLHNETGGCMYQTVPEETICHGLTMFPLIPILSYDYLIHYMRLNLEVTEKARAGYPVSIVDYWGRSLALKLINSTRGGINTSWADISNYDYWCSEEVSVPFPIVVANEQNLRAVASSGPLNTAIEFTPYEMGSWNPTLAAFVDIKYLGTYLRNGYVYDPTRRDARLDESGILNQNYCVTGIDNVGFILGTSSAVFNDVFFLYDGAIDVGSFYVPGKHGTTCLAVYLDGKAYITQIPLYTLEAFKPLIRDRAIYAPNPFFQYETNDLNWNITMLPEFYLVDGGEDGQNLPLEPLIQPIRGLDIILAYDFSADTRNWPTGHTLVQSFEKFNIRAPENGIPFPYVPHSKGTLKTPLFLGCDLDGDYPELDPNESPPLIVYIPNTDFVYPSNRSTFQISYSHWELSKMIENGYSIATQGNSSHWKTCIACAMVKRSLDPWEYPPECDDCYYRYCYHHPSYYK